MPGAPPASAPSAAVTITPPLIDFGVVKPGTSNRGVFKIQNHGATTLRIESSFPSCKCTTVTDLAGKEIPPGGELELVATLDAPRTPGEKDAKVFVKIVDSPQPLIAKMQGDVRLPLVAKPAFIDALKGKLQGSVELSNPTGAPFRVISCDGQPPVFLGYDPSRDPPQASYRLRWDFSMVPEGKLQQWWCVETDAAECPIVPLRIRHETTGIRFDPKMDERRWFIPEGVVVAGRIAANQPMELELEIESTVAQGKPQPPGWDAVRAVQSAEPLAEAEFISSERRGDHVRIKFRFKALKPGAGFIYAPMMVRTDTGAARFFVAATVQP
jgi:hypothetical protein